MTKTIFRPLETTLGEFIAVNYPDFTVDNSIAGISLDTDITHGLEFETFEHNRYYTRNGETVIIYPYVKFTDGCYRPVYFDSDYRVRLTK